MTIFNEGKICIYGDLSWVCNECEKKAERHRTPFQTLLNFPHLPE